MDILKEQLLRSKELMGIITEARKWEMAKNGKKWGTDSEDRLTQEFYNELKAKAGIEMGNLGLVGKTINLYKQAAQDGEGEVIGKYKITKIINKLDFVDVGAEISDKNLEWPIVITFVKEGGTSGPDKIVVEWRFGCYGNNPLMKVGRHSESESGDDLDYLPGMIVINTQFTKTLQDKVCDFENGFIAPYIEMRGLIKGGDWQIVEDADFASNDQQGDDIGGSEVA